MTSVALLEWGENGEEKLTVLAQISYTNLRQNWQVPVSLEFLESDDPLELAALIKDAKEGRSGVRKLRHEGRESLWAYGAPGPGGAFPVIIVPYDLIITQAIETKDSVLQMTQQSLQLISLFLLGVIALVTLLAVFVSRWVIRPVSQLSEAAIQLSHGHYQTRINIQTGDELQELGDVFNEMGPRLEKAMEELKMRQQQLIQADKMSSLGVLVSGVAHEINNPNSLILLNISQLQRAWIDIAATLEERFQQTGDFQIDGSNYSEMREEPDEMMRDIRDGATRIKGIVDDLKDFARCDDTGFMESVDLNEVTIAALRLVENSSNNATDQFSIQLEENLPQFTGNRQRIEQVVVNLIINASQALERAEQRIFLRTFLSAEKGELVLEVEDEGRGILQKHLSMLADPFFTTRRDIGGTGLGLSISTGIAKEHGGRIEFDSTPEVGTLVRLVLPRR
jgi:signal transduction histidine kinase